MVTLKWGGALLQTVATYPEVKREARWTETKGWHVLLETEEEIRQRGSREEIHILGHGFLGEPASDPPSSTEARAEMGNEQSGSHP